MLTSTYEKHKHLIGTQINKWTVLDITEHEFKDKGYIFATCQCVCDTIRDVRLSNLVNNKSLDCGCGQRERLNELTKQKYHSLIDTTINGWTILEIIPPGKHHHTFAKCRCQCGIIKDVNLRYILNEKSKNCGCGRKKTLHEKRTQDLVGQRFGKLTVLEMLTDRNNQKRIMYRCKCDCGNEIHTSGLSLKQHHTSSCGCLLSYYNMYINQYLKKIGIEFIPEYTVKINGGRYRFDFYLPKYNLFIEYDGEQHYKPVKFRGHSINKNSFELTQQRDALKNHYCEENGINLLRIPYWEKENIETIISNHLQRLNEEGLAKVS